ncbi:MAG: TolC family protein [Vicinamibacterales bacterium]
MRKLARTHFVVTAGAVLFSAALAMPARAQAGTAQQPPQQPPTTSASPLPPVAPTPAGQTLPTQAPPVQLTATHAPFVTPGPRVDLTIEDAVKHAMQNNINIGVARLTPRLTDYSIVGLEASYRPTLTSAGSEQRAVRLPSSVTGGISQPTTAGTQAWSAGLAQNLWHGGGNYSASWTNNRQAIPSTNNLRNPAFNTTLNVQFTQPLLRGFKIDATRAAILTNRLQEANDEISLTTTTESTEDSVRNAYWDLVYAIQAVEAAQSTLDLANTLVQQNQQRVEIGTLAPLDVTTARSQAASDQLAVVQDEANVRTMELTLKQLIVSGTDDPLWTSSINPVDRPAPTAQPIDVDAAIARALKQRTDLQQSKNNLDSANINLKNQLDQTRPQLNLTASYGLAGLGGPYHTAAIDPNTGLVIPNGTGALVPSGYFDAISNLYGFDAPTWNIGFSFSYPIGMSSQQATVERTKLSVEQTQANLKQLQLQIATDVTSAALTVQSSLESVQTSGTARELAKEELDAAVTKFQVGMATNYDVVLAQRDYASAQDDELRAIANYRKALVTFEAAQTIGSRSVGSTSTSSTSTSAPTSTSTSSSSTGGTSSGSTGSSGGGTSGGGGL